MREEVTLFLGVLTLAIIIGCARHYPVISILLTCLGGVWIFRAKEW